MHRNTFTGFTDYHPTFSQGSSFVQHKFLRTISQLFGKANEKRNVKKNKVEGFGTNALPQTSLRGNVLNIGIMHSI